MKFKINKREHEISWNQGYQSCDCNWHSCGLQTTGLDKQHSNFIEAVGQGTVRRK